MDSPSGTLASGSGSSKAIYAALEAVGVDRISIEDMVAKDDIVRDFKSQTGSVDSFFESVEDTLRSADAVSRHQTLLSQLQRIAAVTEKLETEGVARTQQIDGLLKRKEEASRKLREWWQSREEKLRDQEKSVSAYEVLAARSREKKKLAAQAEAKAEAARTAEAEAAKVAAEQAVKDAEAPAAEASWAAAGGWSQGDWGTGGSSAEAQGYDWQTGAWAASADADGSVAQGCSAEGVDQGAGGNDAQATAWADGSWAADNYDANAASWSADADATEANGSLNAAAPEFTPAATVEAVEGAQASPEVVAKEESDGNESEGSNPWIGLA